MPLSCRHHVHCPVLQVCWTRWLAVSSRPTAMFSQPAFWPSTLRPALWSARCHGSASSQRLLPSCPGDWNTRPSSSWVAHTTSRILGSAWVFAPTPSTRGMRTPTPVRGCGLPSSCQAPLTCLTGAGGPSRTSPAPSVAGCFHTACPYRHQPSTGEYGSSDLLSDAVNGD